MIKKRPKLLKIKEENGLKIKVYEYIPPEEQETRPYYKKKLSPNVINFSDLDDNDRRLLGIE